MFIASIDPDSRVPKYEQLYRHIRRIIVTEELAAGEKLPSKRALASHLNLAVNTVENAYAQLQAEGYVESREKRGYYVNRLHSSLKVRRAEEGRPARVRPRPEPAFDLRTNVVDVHSFPWATWAKLMRECLKEKQASLLDEADPLGDPQLRAAIAEHLRLYRSISVDPARILVGAGTAFLLGVLNDMLPESSFAIENPCYPMVPQTLRNRRVAFANIPLDANGMNVDALRESEASLVFLTPSFHFPLGREMGLTRRLEILGWASEAEGRYVIEDDYDGEFRFGLRPMRTLFSLDNGGRVIFMNTFSRTIAPSLRIAYIVLPEKLVEEYHRRMLYHPNTVSVFEQRTLSRFLSGGHYERHLNRMRKNYKKRRDAMLRLLKPLGGNIGIRKGEASLQILLRSEKGVTEADLIRRAEEKGVRVYGLSSYYQVPCGETHSVIAGYARLTPGDMQKACALLCEAWK